MEEGRALLQTLRAKGSPAAGKGSDAAGGSEADGQSSGSQEWPGSAAWKHQGKHMAAAVVIS